MVSMHFPTCQGCTLLSGVFYTFYLTLMTWICEEGRVTKHFLWDYIFCRLINGLHKYFLYPKGCIPFREVLIIYSVKCLLEKSCTRWGNLSLSDHARIHQGDTKWETATKENQPNTKSHIPNTFNQSSWNIFTHFSYMENKAPKNDLTHIKIHLCSQNYPVSQVITSIWISRLGIRILHHL